MKAHFNELRAFAQLLQKLNPETLILISNPQLTTEIFLALPEGIKLNLPAKTYYSTRQQLTNEFLVATEEVFAFSYRRISDVDASQLIQP